MIILLIALCSAALAFWRAPQMPRYWPLLAIATVPQIANLFAITIPWMLWAAIAAVLLWCFCNWGVRGAPIVALGVGLNLIVMTYHRGSMPIRADVLASIGHSVAPGTLLVGSKDVVVQSSILWLLGDWIVIADGPTPVVLSPGDLILLAGVAWWLLLSHRSEKEHTHGKVGHDSDVARTTYAAITRAK